MNRKAKASSHENVPRRAAGEGRAAGKSAPSVGGGKLTPFPRQEPHPPFPTQQQPHPGLESRMRPRPHYEATEYHPANKLEDKVALITGGDSGIGRAVAVLFAREGADVAIVYLPDEQSDAEETRAAIEETGRRALLLPGDVTDPRFCHEAVNETVRTLGGLDVLVNNAAYQQHHASIEEISYDEWDKTFKTNIYGYFCMAKEALAHLPEGGVIINTGSITGFEGSKQLLDYSATKGAIHAFTKSLAQNLIERKIRVNAVAPGPIWTPLQPSDKEPKEVSQHGTEVPMQRPGQPEEVAPAYVFLASDADSSYISGEVISILGGATKAG